jgi:hypothetical protein
VGSAEMRKLLPVDLLVLDDFASTGMPDMTNH